MSFTQLPSRIKWGVWVGVASLAILILLRWGAQEASSNAGDALHLAAPRLVCSGAFTSTRTSLGKVLQRAYLPPAHIQRIVQAMNGVLDVRTIRSDDRYELVRAPGGEFERLTIQRGLKKYIVEGAPSAPLAARAENIPLQDVERSAAGTLKISLWETMSAQGLDAQVIMSFADVFAWNIDFLTEPREGDHFALIWTDRATAEGKVADRTIVAAVYDGKNTGRQEAVLFNGDYFAPDGLSHRRAFLHAPLNFRRISSGFSLRRFHPVLRIFRPHLGIDYAAASGTPIVTIGDGTVIFKGWKTAYGNYLMIRHNGSYTSCYGHLSRYAKGIHSGSRVKQGQVVGYVGSTGWSTGPHLDFRISKNGQFVNFLKLKMPADRKVTAQERPAFDALVQEYADKLKDLEQSADAAK